MLWCVVYVMQCDVCAVECCVFDVRVWCVVYVLYCDVCAVECCVCTAECYVCDALCDVYTACAAGVQRRRHVRPTT